MFSFFKRKKRTQGTNAVVVTGQGIAWASVLTVPGQTPVLQALDYIEVDSAAALPAALKTLVQKNRISKQAVITCLMMDEASLIMLEKPEVPDNELRQAVRWRVKDSLAFDINDAIIDVFEIPGQKERGRTPLVYVVAAEKHLLQQRIALFEDMDMEIDSIDVAELVMRNIASLLPEDNHGVALLKLDQHQGLITLTQDKALYLARNIETGFDVLVDTQASSLLGEPAHEADGLQLEQGLAPDQQRALDAITLEVQRSLDYYESHFAKPAITHLVLAPVENAMPGLTDYLASALGVQVRMLDMSEIMDCQITVDNTLLAQGFFAIATALRLPQADSDTQGRAA